MLFKFRTYLTVIRRKMSTPAFSEDVAVKKLIEYLRIKTVHPEPDYSKKTRLTKQNKNTISLK